ncbi:putative membrane protein [Fluviicoccus keumensis]|uniref:Putative membrane protein n=2 Tax=Fluviicoccus keumensis TaxID=1435465 RepID=A0A4Q7Z3Z5_9GAMM|nr:putative membrane protein [Fluviicoccus keumensis]
MTDNFQLTNAFAWLSILGSGLIVLGYEWWFRESSKLHPLRFARTAHAHVRAQWVQSLMRQPGNELLAIQTIRNSVMSSSIIASTAILTLMGTVSLLTQASPGSLRHQNGDLLQVLTPGSILAGLLIAILLMTFVLSTMAVRFFNHAGYLMTTLSTDTNRESLIIVASRYMVRAGNHYSQAMRTLFWLSPVAAGLISIWLVAPTSLVLIRVLSWFDHAQEPLDGLLKSPDGQFPGAD